MKKYFMGLEWKDSCNQIMHLNDADTNLDEYVMIPAYLDVEKMKSKKCIGAINPLTREYINCHKIIDEKQTQCYACMHMFDFYNCIRCHGEKCMSKDNEVISYCNTSHYVYLAYFSKDKIKVGTASEIRKYDRLLEQGAVYSIFIAKTPTGKIARQIEKSIIDNGIPGIVTTLFKMKNIALDSDAEAIRKQLFEKHQLVLEFIDDEMAKYFIEPEFNHFDSIRNNIEGSMLLQNSQMDLFSTELSGIRPYNISKSVDYIIGKFLFAVGKIIAIENNGIVELHDSKKMEGFLFEFKNVSQFEPYGEK